MNKLLLSQNLVSLSLTLLAPHVYLQAMHYSTIYISHPSVPANTDHRMLAVLSELGFTLGTLSQQSRNGYFCVDNNFSSIIVIIFHGDYRRRRRGVAVVLARKSHPRNPFSDFGLGGVESEKKKKIR